MSTIDWYGNVSMVIFFAGCNIRCPYCQNSGLLESDSGTEVTLEGNVGAGTGCSVGKILGPGNAMKAGIGTASIDIGGGAVIGAIVAVNAWGDVINPENREIIAGARSTKIGPITLGSDGYFADSMEVMKSLIGKSTLGLLGRSNTIIGVVATNVKLDKNGANKIAQMAHNGIAQTIRPAHTMLDGDTLFVLGTGKRKVDINIVGAYAAEVVSEAILRGVKMSRSAWGLPGFAG